MTFKKKNIKKTNNLLNFIGTIIILSIIFLGFYTVNSINIGSSKKIITETSSGKIIEETIKTKKDLNILLIGRGGIGNDAPHLTDTIILAKINSEKKSISMLSIQRDLYVNYPLKDGHGKINSVYSHYYYKKLRENSYNGSQDLKLKNAEKYAVSMLAEKIKDITGENVDFYINIDFDGFKKIIDAIGGIEVDVKENLVDRTYPDGNWGYQTISFKKGLQTMNGDLALKYSRSRHSTSEYDRSLRQQQVIKAVKEKLISVSLDEVKSLYEIFTKYLSTDLSLQDVFDLVVNFSILKEKYEFISSNFNDSCFDYDGCKKGGIVYTPNREFFGGQWVTLIDGSTSKNLSKYDLSRKYSDIVLNEPFVQKENFEINIFNASGVTGLAGELVPSLKRFGFNADKKYIFNSPEKYEKSVIYYNGVETNSDTINALKKIFKGDFEKISEAKYPIYGKTLKNSRDAKIEIIIGKDYKKFFNF